MKISIFIALLLLPSATAWFIEDPAGDAALILYPLQNEAGTAPDSLHGGLDIVSFSITENMPEDAIDFAVTTSNAPSLPRESVGSTPRHAIRFSHGGTALEVELIADTTQTPVHATVDVHTLAHLDADTVKERIYWKTMLPVHDDGRTLSASVPRLVLDAIAPMRPGTVFEDVQLWSHKNVQYVTTQVEGDETGFGARVEDRAPASRTNVELAYGSKFTPDLLIWSPSMIRASNGGASTIVFPMQLHTAHEEVEITVVDAPSNWKVAIPFSKVQGPVDGLSVPIIITAEFAHGHGKLDLLTVKAAGGGEEATAPIGIDYLEIPQPTGHHSTVWLHAISTGAESPFAAVFPAEYLVMNAARDDDRDRGTPIEGEASGQLGSMTRSWSWEVPLDPRMRLGIDPIQGEPAQLELQVESPVPVAAAWSAKLAWRTGVGDEILYEGTADAQHDSNPTPILIELPPTEAAHRRSGSDTANLVLLLTADGNAPTPWMSPNEMAIHPGSSLELPFHEFSDSIIGVLPPSDLSFGLDAWHNVVPPGTTFDRTVRITNSGNQTKTVDFQAQGVAPLELTIQPRQLTIPPGGIGNATATIRVPTDAPRQSFNAIVAVSDVGDFAILQWEITADDQAASPPGAHAGKEGKRTPAGAAGLLAVVSVAFVRRGRYRCMIGTPERQPRSDHAP